MSRLDAAAASALCLGVAEEGGWSVTFLTLDGAVGADPGLRRVVAQAADGGLTTHGSLGHPGLDEAADRLAQPILRSREAPARPVRLDPPGSLGRAGADPRGAAEPTPEGAAPGPEVYVELRAPVPELIIVGAGHIARPVCAIAAALGFEVTVLDDRPDFATRERFPEASTVSAADFDHPFAGVRVHGGTHVLLVTRGHRFDFPCLVDLLGRDPAPAWIGMIGSLRRVRATFRQLVDDGMEAGVLGRIHAPVGLDIGAETPEEIAVAVAAELVLLRRGGTGRSLRDVADVAERFFGAGRAPAVSSPAAVTTERTDVADGFP